MRLFPKELEIAPGEGFTTEKDIFGRAGFGQQLTSIVSRVDAPLVILLDAPWGEGKTTFIKMWAGELKKRNIPSIYFDAFATDYQDNAFIALSSHIIDELDVAAPSSAKSKKVPHYRLQSCEGFGQSRSSSRRKNYVGRDYRNRDS
jgi:predicted KAP-like P-loop ATPase